MFVIVVATGLATTARLAAQQTDPADRGYVSTNAALQTGIPEFSERTAFATGQEKGSLAVDYGAASGAAFDIGAAVKLGNNIGAGLAVTRVGSMSDSSFVLADPHPVAFNRPRELSGSVGDLKRTETLVHLQALYFASLSDRARLVVQAGPTVAHIDQDIVGGILLTDVFPFNTITFASADVIRVKKTKMGYHAGVDVSWRVGGSLGLGAIVRFSRASMTLETTSELAGARRLDLDAGGLQIGGGVRWFF